jgi:hypothetical protein
MVDADGKIDRNMRVLVSILQHYLNIKIYSSCGGHKRRSGLENPAPKGEFHVSFVLPQNSPEGGEENNLSIIKEATRMYEGKIFLENDHETYNYPLQDGWCSWTISGYDVTPIHFASTVFSQYLLTKRNR